MAAQGPIIRQANGEEFRERRKQGSHSERSIFDVEQCATAPCHPKCEVIIQQGESLKRSRSHRSAGSRGGRIRTIKSLKDRAPSPTWTEAIYRPPIQVWISFLIERKIIGRTVVVVQGNIPEPRPPSLPVEQARYY